MLPALALLLLASEPEWPSFRGAGASGVANTADIPIEWDAKTNKNVRWRISVPGLAHSSPVVANGRIFLTTAVSSREGAGFKKGLYGAGTASDDTSEQRMLVLCYDARDGRKLWERVAYTGPPKEKRHIKSTYASATPVTDGRVVVALFGSHGLYAYDMKGKPLWAYDLGKINAGAYDAPDYEWGTASSPIIHENLVFVQVDQQNESFIIAVNKYSGKQVWRTNATNCRPGARQPWSPRAVGRCW